ncbi:MAG: 3'-5' exonuclease [Caldilineaceae bacterium]
MFRAKGREWPVVIVPHCNEGFLPYKTAKNIEEERRLLYVAITRARRDFHLHYVEKYEVSPFLLQAQYLNLLGALRRVATAAGKAPAQWDEGDQRAIATYTEPLNLGNYFGEWAGWQEDQRQAAATSMTGFFRRVADQKLFGRLKLRPNFADLWRRLANGGNAPAAPLASSPSPSSTVTAKGRSTKARAKGAGRSAKTPAWESGMRVRHQTWGAGTVIKVLHSFSPPAVWVRFDELRGPKRFAADTDELRLV